MLDDDAMTAGKKADFTGIYNQPDPRAYFGTLAPLDYQITQQAKPVFEAVIAASERAGRPRTVLDVCCSYGINAALLRTDVGLDEIGARYTDPAIAEVAPPDMIDADTSFFTGRTCRPDLPVLGLDISEPAIDYARRTGLLADGWAEDLEDGTPSPVLAAGLRDVGLIICTGGVGYIGRNTFDQLLASVDEPQDLWLAIFVLRVFGYEEIAQSFTGHGLVTEQVPGTTFRQRRFADADEFEAANHDVVQRGLDPTGKEADGWYHADCYITRPAAAAAQTSIEELLTGILPA